jgi:hypothetical protein
MPYLNLEYFYYKIYEFFAGSYNFIVANKSGFLSALYWVKIFAFSLSAFFVLGIVYSFLKLLKLRKKQIAEFAKSVIESPPEERSSRWDKIKKYMESNNPLDWKWAVLEADNLLEDIIKKIGYKGETFGERLAKIKPAQFKNLDNVWQAHKVRNRIAHESADFKLTKEEAERVLGLYEKALEELEYI